MESIEIIRTKFNQTTELMFYFCRLGCCIQCKNVMVIACEDEDAKGAQILIFLETHVLYHATTCKNQFLLIKVAFLSNPKGIWF